MKEDSTCLRVVLQQLAHVPVVTFIYTTYKFRIFGYPKAKYGIRTRDTNLEGWDVTTTPISQRVGDCSPDTSLTRTEVL